MVIIFNKDGSIFDTNLSEYVMQGSNNVNNINVAFVDNTYENWSASFNFVLPNEDKHTLVGVSKQFLYKGVMYIGWSVALTNNETLYNGTLKTTISLLQDNQTLYTYVFNITIN